MLRDLFGERSCLKDNCIVLPLLVVGLLMLGLHPTYTVGIVGFVLVGIGVLLLIWSFFWPHPDH